MEAAQGWCSLGTVMSCTRPQLCHAETVVAWSCPTVVSVATASPDSCPACDDQSRLSSVDSARASMSDNTCSSESVLEDDCFYGSSDEDIDVGDSYECVSQKDQCDTSVTVKTEKDVFRDDDSTPENSTCDSNTAQNASYVVKTPRIVSPDVPMQLNECAHWWVDDATPNDALLEARVLVLLWAALGERRLRQVGFPSTPPRRLLWNVVDVCCSAIGAKSASAVPLGPGHKCDGVCFRDHAHRFLEVCAPAREHWKAFGWAGLTVDAVLKKVYDRELAPLVAEVPNVPSVVRCAVLRILRLDAALAVSPEPPRTPPPKRRGRPSKPPARPDPGRIERVMLWRFLLNLLEDSRNISCIHWLHRDEGIFRIVNTEWLARMWGRRNGNPRMTYEKMARAMRTYYRSKVLQPVPRTRNLPRKLVYKFNPSVVQKVAGYLSGGSDCSGVNPNYNETPS